MYDIKADEWMSKREKWRGEAGYFLPGKEVVGLFKTDCGIDLSSQPCCEKAYQSGAAVYSDGHHIEMVECLECLTTRVFFVSSKLCVEVLRGKSDFVCEKAILAAALDGCEEAIALLEIPEEYEKNRRRMEKTYDEFVEEALESWFDELYGVPYIPPGPMP